MTPQDPEKRPERRPAARPDAEFESNVVPPHERLDDSEASELLIAWDELSRDRFEDLSRDPRTATRLAHLQRAEAWLAARLRSAAPCPTANVLYDYGRGPGYEALGVEDRKVLRRHLDGCSECRGFVQSLQASPPLPLDVRPPLDGPPVQWGERDPRGDGAAAPGRGRVAAPARRGDAGGPFAEASPRPAGSPAPAGPGPLAGERAGGPRGPSRPALRRLAPIAAAAAVLAIATLFVERGRESRGVAAIGLPETPLLRGEGQSPLLFPRGKVLAAPPADLPRSRTLFASKPEYEVEPVEGAERYRFVVLRHDGGAFARGTEMDRMETRTPRTWGTRGLRPGYYTWEAWAVVDRLDQYLGARDFQIVEEPGLGEELEDLGDEPAVWRLHEAGFFTDARTIARHLPPSPEREAYLRGIQGR